MLGCASRAGLPSASEPKDSGVSALTGLAMQQKEFNDSIIEVEKEIGVCADLCIRSDLTFDFVTLDIDHICEEVSESSGDGKLLPASLLKLTSFNDHLHMASDNVHGTPHKHKCDEIWSMADDKCQHFSLLCAVKEDEARNMPTSLPRDSAQNFCNHW